MHRFRWLVLLLVFVLFASACGRDGDDESSGNGGSSGATTTTAASGSTDAKCSSETLQATDVGVTADTITVQVMADVGSSLAPGLFQGNLDALKAYETYANAHGGIGCRKLVVKTWDSKLSAEESKNGLIDACKNAFALVGGNSLFNPDTTPMTGCVDKQGAATGLPDLAALANDINEQCASTAFILQAVAEPCDVRTGPRPLKNFTGAAQWWLDQVPGLHGMYMVPGDLPTTVQSATIAVKGLETIGIKVDAALKVSGRDEQSAYTPRIQVLKANSSNVVFNGSNDRAMVSMRKESKAQGLDTVKVWGCGLSCYTKAMLSSGGPDVEGTYVWLQFLPFEEKDTNKELAAYVDGVGANKADSFGAQAWQAAALFKTVVDNIVKADGPNAVTRARVLEELKNTKDFDANGWMGKKDLRGMSDCYVMLQIKGGKFVRVFPKKRGTLSCDPANITTITMDPVAEAAKIK